MTTASQKVFATVELLEMILFKFPTNSLLQSQRISKHFKAVIETSKKLQQALFIEPIRIDDGILTYLPDCEYEMCLLIAGTITNENVSLRR